MEEKAVITLEQKQIIELEEIIIERDKEAALKFLNEYVYKPIKRKEKSHLKPQV